MIEIDIETPINNITQAEGLKENIILEMVDQLKGKFEEVCKFEIKFKKRNKLILKHFFKCFGLIKAIEKMSIESMEVPSEIQNIIDLLVDINEEFLDDNIFENLSLDY